NQGHAAFGIYTRLVFEPSAHRSMKVIEAHRSMICRSFCKLGVELVAGVFQNFRRSFIREHHLAIAVEDADAVVYLCEDFWEVKRNRHEDRTIISSFGFRNSNMLSSS